MTKQDKVKSILTYCFYVVLVFMLSLLIYFENSMDRWVPWILFTVIIAFAVRIIEKRKKHNNLRLSLIYTFFSLLYFMGVMLYFSIELEINWAKICFSFSIIAGLCALLVLFLYDNYFLNSKNVKCEVIDKIKNAANKISYIKLFAILFVGISLVVNGILGYQRGSFGGLETLLDFDLNVGPIFFHSLLILIFVSAIILTLISALSLYYKIKSKKWNKKQ